MRLAGLVIAASLTSLLLPICAASAEAEVCQRAADEIIRLIDVDHANELLSHFPAEWAETPNYFETVLGTMLREFGHPSEFEYVANFNESEYSTLGLITQNLTGAYETFAYRTMFQLEGVGVVFFKLMTGGQCEIRSLVFGLPLSRSDARRRTAQATRALSEDVEAFFEKQPHNQPIPTEEP